MNLFGKILTGLILVSSLVFFVVAVMVGASHTNWKKKAQDMSEAAQRFADQAQAAKRIRDDAEKQFRTEQVARALQISNLNSQIEILKEQVRTLTADHQQATEDKENYQRSLNETRGAIAKLDSEIEGLKKTNADYLNKIVETKNSVVSLTNQKYNLENELALIKERESALADQNTVMTKALKIREIDPHAPTADIAPRLDGQIVQVDRQLNLIIANLGLDDGLRVGHTLEIHRDGRFVGSAEVVSTDNNRSAAKLIDDLMQRQVQQGDHVTTKF